MLEWWCYISHFFIYWQFLYVVGLCFTFLLIGVPEKLIAFGNSYDCDARVSSWLSQFGWFSSSIRSYCSLLNPEVFNLGSPGSIKLASLIEMSIGAAVGAITFSGSIIAFKN